MRYQVSQIYKNNTANYQITNQLMHKKLASDLTALAHSILRIKDKNDVVVLKEKALKIYEKLAVLAYVDEYLATTPQATITKEELIEKIEFSQKLEPTAVIESENLPESNTMSIEDVVKTSVSENFTIEADTSESDEKLVSDDTEDKISSKNELEEEKTQLNVDENPFEPVLETLFPTDDFSKDDVKDVGELKTRTLEEELNDTISADVAVDLFTKTTSSKTLNDQFYKSLKIGLNDRIAFVKHLFDGNHEDFNRVVSQINTMDSEKEAKKFINKTVKPDYNWGENVHEYEERFINLIERKFN